MTSFSNNHVFPQFFKGKNPEIRITTRQERTLRQEKSSKIAIIKVVMSSWTIFCCILSRCFSEFKLLSFFKDNFAFEVSGLVLFLSKNSRKAFSLPRFTSLVIAAMKRKWVFAPSGKIDIHLGKYHNWIGTLEKFNAFPALFIFDQVIITAATTTVTPQVFHFHFWQAAQLSQSTKCSGKKYSWNEVVGGGLIRSLWLLDNFVENQHGALKTLFNWN